MSDHEQFMRRAIELARQTSLIEKAGGPFGCVIVRDSEIVGEGANTVLSDRDATCHGEMNAIRNACKSLGTHDLSGCVLYTTGEPCPMCYGAICWSKVEKIYYASTADDAREYGNFDDAHIAESLRNPIEYREVSGTQILHEEMVTLWNEFKNSTDQIHY
jgi:tRNA(Arg) A34 adenosine deaminase TadA